MPSVTLFGFQNGATALARAQPSLSSGGSETHQLPLGDAISRFTCGDMVETMTASAWPPITPSTPCFQPGNSTFVTSSQVTPPKAIKAVRFTLSAGAPLIQAIFLPLRSAATLIPASPATTGIRPWGPLALL